MHKDELDIATLGLSASLTNALRLGLAADHHNRPQRMTEFQALLLGSAAQIPATSAEPKPAKTPASEVPRTSAQPKSSIKTWVLAALGGTVIAVIALGSLRQQQPELASSPTQTVQPVAQIPPALVQPVSQPEPLTKQKTEKDATELKIDTRFGAFKIVSGKSEEGCNNDILLFRERTTGLGNYCGLSFLAVYAIRDMDVLLLSDSSSNPRNGEDFAQVVLLTVKSDGQVRQISSPQHFSGSDESEPMPKLVDGHVVVDLGFEDGQRKKAVFNGETLTFTLENPNSKEIFPIPSKDCGELFHLVTRYCVGLDSCVIPTEGLNVFSMDYRKKHHPAIKTPRFSDVCTTVCNKGRAPSGADFKLQFCGVS
jgi:hypothetical protein